VVTETRVDPLTGAVVVVTESRQDRPNLPSGCPFCPGGLESPEPYDVRWFPNRWPPMDGERCEIILFSPDHDANLGGLGAAGVRRVVDLWSERTATLSERDDVKYVLLFENRGPAVGASIDHPHGQLYAFDHVPGGPQRELRAEHCALCASVDAGDRLVGAAGDWQACVPWGPTWPYELLLAPRSHIADLPTTPAASRDELALVLSDALVRLDQLFEAPMPYMLWVHQRPTDGNDWPAAHLHIHVAPVMRQPGVMRFTAAGELGSGVWFDPVVPEAAAAALRALPGSR
jgi:UDPglucose--hexose-1-phosphate uridylyltransferase